MYAWLYICIYSLSQQDLSAGINPALNKGKLLSSASRDQPLLANTQVRL